MERAARREGTEILNISAGQDVNWTMSIDYSTGLNNVQGQLDPYLTLDREASTGNFVLKVQRTLDLEQIFADLHVQLPILPLRLFCRQPGNVQQKFDVFLNVEPVNEFEPEFQSRIINVNISEHEGLATTLIVLASVASDRDVNPTTNEIHGFSFQPYDYARFNGKPGDDGRSYFKMADSRQGRIELQKQLDFETLAYMSQTVMWLNVTVTDTSGNSSWAVIRVTVLDYDDLSPEFYYSGCPDQFQPCLLTYMIRVLTNTTGPVHDITPAPIFAHDRDTLDNPVTYQLKDSSVGGLGLASHLHINSTTGELTVVQPFLDLDFYQNIVFVEAEEVSANRFTAQATLQIDVYSPTFDPAQTTDTNLSSSPSENTRRANPPVSVNPGTSKGDEPDDDSSNAEQIAIIGMAVLGVLVLALLVVVFVLGLTIRKLHIARIGPTEEEGEEGFQSSRPEDEETASRETQSTSGEASPRPKPKPVVDQTELLSSLPDAADKAGKLPPLQPAATSNGPAQPDVFDGTRTFEMGLNPEFFTTPGKTRVPLEPNGQVETGEPIVIKDEA
nr:hypothetical protein BaRGS_000322 [Batillaria attramentaria]